ncbi:MAG: DUF1684 domain-containing protein, partial [Putridiphycobacter sp.]|nr:DUF1684 domain-containing protein [Putridiphycobacter sp.]
MRSLLFVLFVFVSLTGLSTGPDSTAIAEIIAWQTEMNEHYMDKEHSPLEKKDRRKFTGHSFFKIDLNYRVKATIELTPKSDTFGMTTNTDRRPLYRQYGIAHFNISGVAYKLSIFQNIKYAQIEGHENSLF